MAGVDEKVMPVDNVEGVRAHLLCCAVKIGVGALSARRQEEWEKAVEKREKPGMVRRFGALGGGEAIASRIEQATELLEKQFLIEIDSAIAANAQVLRNQFRATIPTSNASNAPVLNGLWDGYPDSESI